MAGRKSKEANCLVLMRWVGAWRSFSSFEAVNCGVFAARGGWTGSSGWHHGSVQTFILTTVAWAPSSAWRGIRDSEKFDGFERCFNIKTTTRDTVNYFPANVTD